MQFVKNSFGKGFWRLPSFLDILLIRTRVVDTGKVDPDPDLDQSSKIDTFNMEANIIKTLIIYLILVYTLVNKY